MKERKSQINIHSEMYQRGYDNIAVCFAYIPEFKTEQDKIDYTAGSKKAITDRQWHVTLAYYSKRLNAIKERRVTDFETQEEGLSYLDCHRNKPLILWHTNATELENPYFAMAETDQYKKEYKKVRD